jgi:hypothetical protein
LRHCVKAERGNKVTRFPKANIKAILFAGFFVEPGWVGKERVDERAKKQG